jgi:hypothetical protein
VLSLGAGAGAVFAAGGSSGNDNAWPYNDQGAAPVLAAVGDISCQAGAQQGTEKATDVCTGGTTATTRNAAQNATAMQVEGMNPALVAVLGDEQYQNGYYSDFENSYEKYWGAFKMLQRPAPGNHEFYDNHGQAGVRGYGYFDYFNGIQHNAADGSEIDVTPAGATGVTQPLPHPNGQAGSFGQTGNGWYSYDLGNWHLISLNAECADEPGGCSNASGTWFHQETTWLAQDLSDNLKPCILAYWHQPTFSSTKSPFTSDSTEGATADAWWQLLYAHNATLVLNGHDHVYSRFAPMNPSGQPAATGIREFIIGTGGESLDTVMPSTPNLEAWADAYYGVLKLTLQPSGYAWDYESAMKDPASSLASFPASYSDTGTGSCNAAGDQQVTQVRVHVQAPAVAGQPTKIVAEALNSAGQPVHGYDDSPTWSDTAGELTGSPAPFVNGVSKTTVTLPTMYHYDVISLTTEGTTGTSPGFNIEGPVAGLRVNVGGPVTAGQPFRVTAAAVDAIGDVVHSYSDGSPTWSDSDGELTGAPNAFQAGVSTTSTTLAPATRYDTITVTSGSFSGTSAGFRVN